MSVQVNANLGVGTAVDVALLEWPAAEELREQLAAQFRPRLLVVAEASPPPVCLDELEDWVRHPVDVMDVVARTTALRHRAERRDQRPLLDDHGLLWLHGRWVSLPPAQQPLVRLLVDRIGHVVPAPELRGAYSAAGGSADVVAFKAAMARLARRLLPLGLHLHNIPGRGSLLEVAETAR